MTRAGIEFVKIPAGRFLLGASDDDRYANRHELPRQVVEMPAFWMSKYPVTEAQLGTASTDQPAVNVSWHEAQGFCEQHDFRLPTEEEWEFVCRAGAETPFPHGVMIELEEANFLYDDLGKRIGIGKRTPVGNYPSNPWGVYDMVGNVAEWTGSDWRVSYAVNTPTDHKVIRGAGWDSLPRLLRASNRDFAPPEQAKDNLGFRVAIDY